MKEYVKNPKPPMPLFTQREDGIREEKAFACGECGSVYGSKESALYCHQMQICADCGQESPKYWTYCSSCRDKRMWDNATEIKPEDHDGPVYDEARDKYFESYDEAMDYFQDIKDDGDEDAIPEWVQPCGESPFPGLDVGSALENMCEDLHKDAYDHLSGVEDLEKAVKIFNEKNVKMVSWYSDAKRKIRVAL